MTTKLVLSPSQQSWNQYAGGGSGAGDSEEHWMEHLATRTHDRIIEQGWGFPVVVVNKGSYDANVAESNRIGATEHVAMHTDAGGGHGTTVFYKTGSKKGAKLANALYPFIKAASNLPDRGVHASSKYGELNQPHAGASVIVEALFHDNAAEAAEMRASIPEFAEAYVKGLAVYYGKTYRPLLNKMPYPGHVVGVGHPHASEVRWIQERLNAKGYKVVDPKGTFGVGTAAAVHAFRKTQGTGPWLIGSSVGPETWKRLAL
jgi:N-acetylmuramoyl-L-alanine amidase